MALLIPAFFLMGVSVFVRQKIFGVAGIMLFAIWFGLLAAQVLGIWVSHP
jgi:hypothetical protein